LFVAVAQHAHLHRRQLAQRSHRALGTALLHAADQRVDQHHGQDHRGIAQVAQRYGQHRGDEQDVDQRALELAQEGAPQRPRRWLRQRVRAVCRHPARCFSRCETPKGIAAQKLEHALGLERVPIGRCEASWVEVYGARCWRWHRWASAGGA
jgi:hypothetical protein